MVSHLQAGRQIREGDKRGFDGEKTPSSGELGGDHGGDPPGLVDVFAGLRRARGLAEQGRAMVAASDEVRLARGVSTRVLFLSHGRGEAEGEPEALFSGATSERFRQFISKERG